MSRAKQPPSDPALAAKIFPGESDMAKLMRSYDWSKTKLGPIEKWPASLRTILGVVLGSRFPMLIWWGPDLLHLYNDAYRPILRDKHPASLAAPAAEIWAEVWDVAGPMARGVQEGGPATWTEDLQLFIASGKMAEETYFTFSYSPIPGDDGAVGGLLNTVQETTTKVQGERQIRMLRDLSEKAAAAASESEVHRAVAEVLSANALDHPFVMLYLVNEGGIEGRLAASGGLKDYKGPALPQTIPLLSPSSWPLTTALNSGREVLVEDLLQRFGPLPPGRWEARPEKAVVLPLFRPGRPDPCAFLISGVSPHRELDDNYRRFFKAVADQVGTVLANARALEEERQRTEALAQLDRAKTEFFANVSHELRTPLTLILAPLEALMAEPGTAVPPAALKGVHNNAVRLLQMINGLLDFSKASAGKVEVHREPVNILDLTRSLFWDFRSVADQKCLNTEFSSNAPEPWVAMDRYLYERILFNLLSNAVKFTPPEGTVAAHLEVSDGKLSLSVTDTGIGIAPKDQEGLFEKFHQVEGSSTRRFEGTGLGLALVKEFSQLLEGHVTLESAPGKGSRFTFTCPAPPAKERSAEKIQASHRKPVALSLGEAPAPSPTLAAGKDLPKLLVAEDNPELSTFLSGLLSRTCQVRTAADGGEALELARSWHPDLVLSDVMMPRLDGIQLTRELKGDPGTSGIPVVLLTAMTNRDSLLRGWEAGADDYLFKPFHPKELEARIRSLLSGLEWRRKGEAYRRQKESLEHFTHIASHDLREPLRKITTFAGLLKASGKGLEDDLRVYLEAITRASGRMLQLLDSLIDYTRLDHSRMEMEVLSLDVLLKGVLEEFGPDLKAAKAEVTTGSLPTLPVRKAELGVVFANLVGNALKYRGKAQPLKLTIGAERKGPEWVFTFSDNGAGFDPTHAERVFILFERLHAEGEVQGAGMGLAICRRIVENHGGRIWALSRPGEGATFHFTLPAEKASAGKRA